MNCLTPDVFNTFYKINSGLHNYGTRQSDNIVFDLRCGARFSFSTKHQGSSVWKELPLSISTNKHESLVKKKKFKRLFFWDYC